LEIEGDKKDNASKMYFSDDFSTDDYEIAVKVRILTRAFI